MLQHLSSAGHQHCNYVLARNENRGCVNIVHEGMWLQRNDGGPVRKKRIGRSPNLMSAPFWSPTEFAMIDVLPRGQTLNSFHVKCVNPSNGRSICRPSYGFHVLHRVPSHRLLALIRTSTDSLEEYSFLRWRAFWSDYFVCI
jgi:hypothetical protein